MSEKLLRNYQVLSLILLTSFTLLLILDIGLRDKYDILDENYTITNNSLILTNEKLSIIMKVYDLEDIIIIPEEGAAMLFFNNGTRIIFINLEGHGWVEYNRVG